MKRLLTALLAVFFVFSLQAQEDRFAALGAKLDEYFAALAGDPVPVQNAECDFLIESCKDSLTRQFVALKIYDHYLNSKIMGDDGVAVHVADTWLIPGKVAMKDEMDLLNAKVFAEFNRQAQLGAEAPALVAKDDAGEAVSLPVKGEYTVLYFYDTSCSTCRIETPRLCSFLKETDFPLQAVAFYTGDKEEEWARYRATSLNVPGLVHAWDPDLESDFQRKYGVLQTPRMFLIGPDGTVLGRGLDTPALRMLTEQLSGKEGYVYGTQEGTALYEKVFAGYGDDLKPEDVLDVAAYVAERTYGEGDTDSYRHMEGDLLYWLSSQTGEVYKEGERTRSLEPGRGCLPGHVHGLDDEGVAGADPGGIHRPGPEGPRHPPAQALPLPQELEGRRLLPPQGRLSGVLYERLRPLRGNPRRRPFLGRQQGQGPPREHGHPP